MRKIRAEDRKIRRKRIILVLLLNIAFVSLLGISYRLYGLSTRTVWDGKNRLNLIFQSKSVFIISLMPSEKSLQVLTIPQGTLIEAAHGYGFYRIESVYSLGKLDNRGGELLTDSLQEYFGLPIDGYLAINNSELIINNFHESRELKTWLTKTIADLLFKGKGESNFTRWDLFRLWWQIRKLRTKEISLISLGETTAFSTVVLPDGSQAVAVDLERFDSLAQQLFTDERIRAENLAIVVLNATPHPGLARRGARMMSNIGGRVVGLGEREGRSEKCEVRSEKGNINSYTVKKVAKAFHCQWGGEDLGDQRADLVLILGEDYWQKLTQ